MWDVMRLHCLSVMKIKMGNSRTLKRIKNMAVIFKNYEFINWLTNMIIINNLIITLKNIKIMWTETENKTENIHA